MVSGITSSHKYNFELPSDIIAFAYYPYVASFRTCYSWYKNISRYQRGSKDGKGQKSKERIGQGRDRRELHDDDDGIVLHCQNVTVQRVYIPHQSPTISYDLTNGQILARTRRHSNHSTSNPV
jgi:hypothetical protein